jgi:hypothetical protein
VLAFEIFDVEVTGAWLAGLGAMLAGIGSFLSGLMAYRLGKRAMSRENHDEAGDADS